MKALLSSRLTLPGYRIPNFWSVQCKCMLAGLALVNASAWAKLPAPVPLDDAGKAKAAETAAKTAWAGKVDGFQLCRSMEKVAAHTQKNGKTKEATVTPACADPGAFVYPPPAAAVVAVASTPATVAAASGKPAEAPGKPAPATAAPATPVKKP